MGLAFKPDIDDLRESPALEITNKLSEMGHTVMAVEPNIELHSTIVLESIEHALQHADIFAFLVKHRSFVDASFLEQLAGKVVLDFCGVRT
jgi:UDP-N-acetyl-D-mannosaminuronic acid dehydrogenase